MKRGTRVAAGCAAFALAIGLAAPSAGQDPTYARGLAATCFTCHGTDGRSVGGAPPSLAGQNKDYLLRQLKEFKEGRRPATIMHQQAKGYTDEELEAIAGYFAGVKPGAAAAPAPAAPAARGAY
jgi:cytochrome c553